MKSIVFVSLQKELIEDLETEKNLDFGDYDYELQCLSSLEGIDAVIKKINPDLVVLSYDALIKRDSWNFGDIPIAYHATSREELSDGAEYGFPTIGIATSSSDIAEKLGEEPYMAAKKSKLKRKSTNDSDDNKESISKPAPKGKTLKQHTSSESLGEKIDDLDFLDDDETEVPKKKTYNRQAKKKQPDPEEWDDDLESDTFDDEEPEDTKSDVSSEDSDFKDEELEDEDADDIQTPDDELPQEEEDDLDELDLLDDKPEPHHSKAQTSKRSQSTKTPVSQKAMPKPKKKENKDYIQQEFEKDLIHEEIDTKVISVYSAKGGVGKTTIATELAVYLSLVSIGKRKLHVCLVDYNIDFGDVRMTLNLSSKDLNLTNWSAEVQELLDDGRTAEDIQYSKEEMSDYLSVDKRSGLSVLQAPVTNEDSMGINSETLNIILDNLIHNGEFDYIICDTGNNTRDSTMIALEHSDIILMIMTQNANTANCDKAFMSTMDTIQFDMSNTKLIINCIMPQKATKISVQEIVDYFPYECVGKLKFNTDVIKATNMAEPLAYQPDHEFTKQLRNIVTYILQQDDYEVDTKPKKKFFDFLHKK